MGYRLIDLEHLLADLPADTVTALISQFSEQALNDLQEIERHASLGDYSCATESAHRLMGGARAMGASGLADLALQAETAFKLGQLPDLLELAEILRQTQIELASFKSSTAR